MTKRRKQPRQPMLIDVSNVRRHQDFNESDFELAQTEFQSEQFYVVNYRTPIRSILYYIYDVLLGALSYLKPFITFITAFVLLFCLLSYGYRLFKELILDTVCPLPVVGQYIPGCKHYSPTIPDFTHFVKLQESLYDSMLSRPPANSISVVELKRVELATRDLQAMVKHSNLMSSDLLESKLGEYIVRSRQFGRDLQSLQAQTRGVIDNLITYNTFTFRKLSEVKSKKSSRQDLRILYEKAMSLVEKEAKRLILAIEKAQGSLYLLEEDLYSIHEITIQEKSHQLSERPHILADLVNKVTSKGLRRKLVQENLDLLVNFDTERNRAAQQLMLMLNKMETFQMDLEELRTQVVAPILVPDAIPLEMHIENIGKTIERLKSSKIIFFEEKSTVEGNQ